MLLGESTFQATALGDVSPVFGGLLNVQAFGAPSWFVRGDVVGLLDADAFGANETTLFASLIGLVNAARFGAPMNVRSFLDRPTSILRPKRVSLERGAPATSTSGEVTSEWFSYATGVPAAVQPRSGNSRQREYGRDVQANFTMFINTDLATAIRVGDRIVDDDVRYTITFLAPRGQHVEADLARVIVP